MSPACLVAIVWHEGECAAATPWIFVNHNTSNAADLQHQKEGSVAALSQNKVSNLSLGSTILTLTLCAFFLEPEGSAAWMAPCLKGQ